MNLVEKNDELIKYFSGDKTLISSQSYKVGIYTNDNKLVIDFDIQLLYKKNDSLID